MTKILNWKSLIKTKFFVTFILSHIFSSSSIVVNVVNLILLAFVKLTVSVEWDESIDSILNLFEKLEDDDDANIINCKIDSSILDYYKFRANFVTK